MKIKVYGYYNYGNAHDQKEHLTATPIVDIESRNDRDYSGNVYEFEAPTKNHLELEYIKYMDEWAEMEIDKLINKKDRTLIQVNPEKYGYTSWNVFSNNGFCYLIPEGIAVPEKDYINLGNIKSHKVE